jgi:hypothetical protein
MLVSLKTSTPIKPIEPFLARYAKPSRVYWCATPRQDRRVMSPCDRFCCKSPFSLLTKIFLGS